MREIVPGVLTWSKLSERHGYDFNGHLLLHPDGNLCIDPVEPDAADLARLVELGAARVLLTNRNHGRAANLLREKLDARTAIHPKDADHARGEGIEIDDAVLLDDRVGPLRAIGVPGKSPGEIALFWEQRALLIVGDAVIGNPPGRCGILPDKVMDDPAQLRQSVAGLLALDFDTLLLGDGVSILSGARDRLQELVAGFSG